MNELRHFALQRLINSIARVFRARDRAETNAHLPIDPAWMPLDLSRRG